MKSNASPLVVIHFFDWFLEEAWKEDEFVDQFNWEVIGHLENERESEDFYFKQFQYIKSLGIDAIAWEYHIQTGKRLEDSGRKFNYPTKNAITALRKSGLKIAPFYDHELTYQAKTRDQADRRAEISNQNEIKPNDQTINEIDEALSLFYKNIPKELCAFDKDGRGVIFIFGYGFDDSDGDPSLWRKFSQRLIESVSKSIKNPMINWSCKESYFQQHLFMHHRENFSPFQFVLDTPQSQFSNNCVTWNFGFDNFGVSLRDQVKRVIKKDERYIQQMAWLAIACNPKIVFIYSWNEPFEDSMLMPTVRKGQSNARCAKSLINSLGNNEGRFSLPSTLLIVDDLDEYWMSKRGDWHFEIERQLIFYPLRRYIPQADVKTVAEISPEILDKYEMIVDISVYKNIIFCDLIKENIKNGKKILLFDPVSGYVEYDVIGMFGLKGLQLNINANIYSGDTSLFARDDINDLIINNKSFCKLSVDFQNKKIPIVVKTQNSILINSYNLSEEILKIAFENLYSHQMNTTILYGEGMESHRLELDFNDDFVVEHKFNRPAVIGEFECEEMYEMRILPKGMDEKYYKTIFGIL